KNGKHAWVSDCLNIAAVSNIPTQVFEHMLSGIQFCTILQSMHALQVRRYALILPISFLCLLENAPEFVNAGIKISAAEGVLFRRLNTQLSDIMATVKAFGAKKK
ncbi:hypothetical protein B0H13DRAFT_1469863, partial [Mycena leptocephala]